MAPVHPNHQPGLLTGGACANHSPRRKAPGIGKQLGGGSSRRKEKGKRMRINKVMTKIKAGQMSYGCNLAFPSAAVVEMLGQVGFDYVNFDAEHGSFKQATLDDM